MKRISIALAALLLCGAGCSTLIPSRPGPQPGPVACTMEAKQCPDGSYVGRSGPKCEFAACPTAPSPGAEGRRCSGAGDSSCGAGYECTQECGPPVMREDDPSPGWSCHVKGQPRMCPICLASNTMIATPSGEINVKDLVVGMRVWSRNARGERVASAVVRVSRTPVPATHRVVHLVLSDTRQLWVSPGHPTVSGEPVGGLRPGDSYDGAKVVSADLVPYPDGFTYDLLTDSATSEYWANGILLGSTLSE